MNIRFSSILSFLLLWAALPCAAQVFESDTTSIYEERLQLLEEFAKEDSMLVRNKVGVRLGERYGQARPLAGGAD